MAEFSANVIGLSMAALFVLCVIGTTAAVIRFVRGKDPFNILSRDD